VRLQLFEFEDFDWFPAILRNYLTDFLHFQISVLRMYTPIVAPLAAAMLRANEMRLVDLCSGGSGPVSQIRRELARYLNREVRATLTDKFPNRAAFERIAEADPDVGFIADEVDVTETPVSLKGVRTMFSAFHHFSPGMARGILADAVAKRQPIGIFELSGRRPTAFAMVALGVPLGVFVLTPWIRPRSLGRLFWTYVVPAVPLLTLWDGTVSNLRTYSPAELRALVAEVPEHRTFDWEIGRTASTVPGLPITYLIGTPAAEN